MEVCRNKIAASLIHALTSCEISRYVRISTLLAPTVLCKRIRIGRNAYNVASCKILTGLFKPLCSLSLVLELDASNKEKNCALLTRQEVTYAFMLHVCIQKY